MDWMDPLVRTWADVTSGRHAPFSFRFVVQPLVAAFYALRAAKQDVRDGSGPYVWTLLHQPEKRSRALREAWKHVGKVFILALLIDAGYQYIELRWIYPGEALIVAALLSVLPYMVLRGLFNRWMRRGRSS